MARLAPMAFALVLAGCARAPLGGPCASLRDCDEGLLCLDALPGGLCSRSCDDGCPDGTLCVDLAGDGYCLPACADGDDCRSGYACSLGHCDLPCGGDEECPAWARCDGTSLGCEPRTDLPAGAACMEDGQCAAGPCAPGPDGGRCTEPCGGEQLCASGLPCGLLAVGGGHAPLCVPAAGPGLAGDLCESGGDCLSGLCASGACVYPCGAGGACEAGARCVEGRLDWGVELVSTAYCLPEAAPGVRVVDLGEVETERGIVRVAIDAPDGIVSLAFVAWTDEDLVLAPRSLVTPEGRVLIDAHGAGAIRTYDRARELTVLVPNTDDPEAAARPGRYSLDFEVHDPGSFMLVDARLRVRVLLKVRDDGRCDRGRMTLNVHLAPRVYGPLNAGNARESPWIAGILDRMRHFYEGSCNVALETVRYYDLTDRFSVIGSEDELHEMFAMATAATPRATVEVFLVRDLGGISEWVAGISGGLPGPPGIGGTPHSGVALEALTDARTAGDVMGHEVGHYLGLFHPTEMDGRTQDPILDTPRCLFDPERPWEMGSCETLDNLMFPVVTGTANELTAGQCLVVLGNPGL